MNTSFHQQEAQNQLEISEEENLKQFGDKSVTVLVRHILSTYHKRERDIIRQIDHKYASLSDEIQQVTALQNLPERWAELTRCHLEHFKEEETVVFADLLKCDIFENETLQVRPMSFGSLSRPFFDLEKDHVHCLKELSLMTKILWDHARNRANLYELWFLSTHFLDSVREHVHFENTILYGAVLRLESAMCM